jgi:hypothetical protein
MGNKYNSIGRKPEWKILLGRPTHRWEDNIKMDFKAIGSEDVNWINVTWDRIQK